MRRGYFLMLVLFAICAIEGCRRGGSVMRPPVKVRNENDFMVNKAKENLNKVKSRKVIIISPETHPNERFTDDDFDDEAEVKFEGGGDDEAGKKKLERLKKKYEDEKEFRDIKTRKEV